MMDEVLPLILNVVGRGTHMRVFWYAMEAAIVNMLIYLIWTHSIPNFGKQNVTKTGQWNFSSIKDRMYSPKIIMNRRIKLDKPRN
jgi:hypothetical protein